MGKFGRFFDLQGLWIEAIKPTESRYTHADFSRSNCSVRNTAPGGAFFLHEGIALKPDGRRRTKPCEEWVKLRIAKRNRQIDDNWAEIWIFPCGKGENCLSPSMKVIGKWKYAETVYLFGGICAVFMTRCV